MYTGDTDIDEMSLEDTSETTNLVGRLRPEMDPSEAKHENGLSIGTKQPKTTLFIWVLAFFSAIGGFLFGYDTGVVSGAMLLVKNDFSLTSVGEEVVVSVTIGSAFVAALCGGVLNDRFGRKSTTILASLVFTIGGVILGAAQNLAMLVTGRLILGIGIGLASMTVPMYIAECSPSHLRGRMVTLNVLFITGGQFVASVMDGAFSYVEKGGWRYMFGLAALPSLIQLIGFLFLPESPRWLMKKGYEEKAYAVLADIRGTEDVEEEIQVLRRVCEEDEELRRQQGDRSTIIRLLTTPSTRRAVIVGCGLQLFQQLTGINTIMYYSASVIKMSGISDQHEAIWLSAATSSCNFIFTIIGVWLVERIGRKKLLLGSLIGVILSLAFLAIGFQLAAFNSPRVTFTERGDNSSCSSFRWCEACIEDMSCGYCYSYGNNNTIEGSCVPTFSSSDTSHAALGPCNETDAQGHIWADNFCPTSYAWMSTLGLGLYLMFFAPGMGPMPWTINSEIYPLWARSTGNSLSAATNWICNLLVSMTFLTMTETLTKYGTYWLFMGVAVLALIFFIIFLPETKGKSLEDVEKLFSKPWCSCGTEHSHTINSNSRTDLDTF
ncbi:proton myo-inositol cotransporter-like [Haliotis rufescens]|uniref:proton myo-inositol cotransporter-like n=1 Tax=Haliotis rufescens TaxID=6454 RepID=UPI00201E8E9D|nr:proton myo-inositol cotransporter-like [Haliotis rufescens]